MNDRIKCNQIPAGSPGVFEAVQGGPHRRQSSRAQSEVPANPLAGFPGMASARVRRLLPPGRWWQRKQTSRGMSRPVLTVTQRLALRMQDALDDTRSELTDAAEPGLATSSFSRAVWRWLSSSRWLHVGPWRPNPSKLQGLTAPDPLADALCHFPKVILAVLLLVVLRMKRSCS